MVTRTLRVLWVVELLALAAGLLAVATGRFDQLWWLSIVVAAPHLAQMAIKAWIARPPRKREFHKPRSAYPNGDNGYNQPAQQ